MPLATAGALAAAAFLTVLAFIGVFSALWVIAPSVAVAPWPAALIVTVIYAIVVKEDLEWIKSDVKLRK